MIWSLISAARPLPSTRVEWSPDDLIRPLFYWAAFIFLDLSAGALGMALERRAPWADLLWMPVQRFGYRQLMYYVVVKSIVAALHGARGRLGQAGAPRHGGGGLAGLEPSVCHVANYSRADWRWPGEAKARLDHSTLLVHRRGHKRCAFVHPSRPGEPVVSRP